MLYSFLVDFLANYLARAILAVGLITFAAGAGGVHSVNLNDFAWFTQK